jgi:uncharacterized repeat protein (TIGR01451 family)
MQMTKDQRLRRVAGAPKAVMAAIVLLAAVAGPVLSSVPPVGAYQYPAAPYSAAGQSSVSGFTVSIDGTGQTSRFGPTTLGSNGYQASDFSPTLPTGAPTVEMRTDGTLCLPNTACTNRGTVTLSFMTRPVRNPVVHIAGLGESTTLLGNRSQLQSQLTLTTAGTLTKLAGSNLTVSGNTIRPTSTQADANCTTAGGGGAPAGCGSVQVTGVVTTVTFSVTLVNTIRTGLGATPLGTGDAFAIGVSFNEDFGDGPASYDAGNAARHILSHQQLGTGVTVDNATTANATSSPNAGPSATGDIDDALANPLPPMRVDTTASYTLSVPYTGGTFAGELCGWIDLDKNGTYEPTERQCAATTTGPGTAALTWPGISGLVAGDTYARFRIGYTTTQVQSPTGPADSGEVEDYVVPIVAPGIDLTKAAGPITDLDGNGPDAGDTITYAFTVTNTSTGSAGAAGLDPVAVTDPLLGGAVASCAGPLAQGATRNCSATYTLTPADTGGTTITNTATASGTPTAGAAVTDGAGTSVAVPVNAAIDLAKTASPVTDLDANGPDAGDTITYTFTVTNTGNVVLDPVSVDDPLLGGAVPCGSGALVAGATRTCPTVTYTVTQADVGTTITNTATAAGTPPSGPPSTDTASTSTLVLPNGTLAITVPSSASLGTIPSGTAAISGHLGTVTVTDNRGSNSALWTASVTSTSFTTGTGGTNRIVTNDNITYASGSATSTSGTGTFVPQSGAPLSTPRIAARWTAGVGNNRASWNPTLTLALSPRLVAGTYTGTITHSVA